MITIRLLGGAQKAMGKSTVTLDIKETILSEILGMLQKVSESPHMLDSENLLVAINGVESSILGGGQAMIKSGDTVTIVTILHGGTYFLTTNHTL